MVGFFEPVARQHVNLMDRFPMSKRDRFGRTARLDSSEKDSYISSARCLPMHGSDAAFFPLDRQPTAMIHIDPLGLDFSPRA